MGNVTDIQILKTLHGREIGIDRAGRLVCPEGFVSAAGMAAGAAIVSGAEAYRSTIFKRDGIIKTQIFIDLTGLASSTTDLDIIGVGAGVAHIGQYTTAKSGVLFAGRMACLELPAGGADDIDLYSAAEGTGVFDGGIAALDETALLTKGGAWAANTVSTLTGLPAANEYLYLTGGESGTAASYTGGRFLIELEGYEIQT